MLQINLNIDKMHIVIKKIPSYKLLFSYNYLFGVDILESGLIERLNRN